MYKSFVEEYKHEIVFATIDGKRFIVKQTPRLKVDLGHHIVAAQTKDKWVKRPSRSPFIRYNYSQFHVYFYFFHTYGHRARNFRRYGRYDHRSFGMSRRNVSFGPQIDYNITCFKFHKIGHEAQ